MLFYRFIYLFFVTIHPHFLTHNRNHTTCTVAKALNVTFLGNSGPGEPRVLITGFRGCRGFNDSRPADAANSFRRCEKPWEFDDVSEFEDTMATPSTLSTPCSVCALGTELIVVDGCIR